MYAIRSYYDHSHRSRRSRRADDARLRLSERRRHLAILARLAGDARRAVQSVLAAAAGCGGAPEPVPPVTTGAMREIPAELLAGETKAVSYSGFREGQHPDRGSGAVNPSA